MVVCYCLFTASLTDHPGFTPRLAKRIELDQMYEELTATLVQIGYLNRKTRTTG
jgi:tRNA/rRNA methyltransferase